MQGIFLERRSASGSLGMAGGSGLATAASGGLSSHLSGSPIREPGGFAARVARAGSPGRSAYGSAGSLSMSRAASAGLPPLGSPSPGSVRWLLKTCDLSMRAASTHSFGLMWF